MVAHLPKFGSQCEEPCENYKNQKLRFRNHGHPNARSEFLVAQIQCLECGHSAVATQFKWRSLSFSHFCLHPHPHCQGTRIHVFAITHNRPRIDSNTFDRWEGVEWGCVPKRGQVSIKGRHKTWSAVGRWKAVGVKHQSQIHVGNLCAHARRLMPKLLVLWSPHC